MRNKLELSLRIAAIALCIFFTQGVYYSQTANTKSSPEVVTFRSKFHIISARRIVFSPISKLLAIQREGGSVQIIDLSDGREQAVLPLSDKSAYSMQWTTDGQGLLVVNSKSAALWDARRGTLVSAPIEIQRDKYFLGFDHVKLSPDARLFLSVREREGHRTSVSVWHVVGPESVTRARSVNASAIY